MMTDEERMTQSYEQDAERTRGRIAATVDDLSSRLSPSNMLGSVTGGGSGMMDDVGRYIREHPVAIGLIGLSLGLLLLQRNRISGRSSFLVYEEDTDDDDYSRYGQGDTYTSYDAEISRDSRGGRVRRGWSSVRSGVGHAGGRVASGVTSAGRGVASGVSQAGSAVRSGVSSAGRTIGGAASDAADFAGEQFSSTRENVVNLSRQARERASRAGDEIGTTVNENPIATIAVGLAAGAILGALLPRTRQENRWVGRTSDRLTDSARSAASSAVDAGRQHLDELGLNREGARSKLSEAGEHAKEIARAATEAGRAKLDEYGYNREGARSAAQQAKDEVQQTARAAGQAAQDEFRSGTAGVGGTTGGGLGTGPREPAQVTPFPNPPRQP